MAFHIKQFYQDLDAHYDQRNNAETEKFLLRCKQEAFEEGKAPIVRPTCPSCEPDILPNYDFISVCNELACFYRGLSRFQESLDTFSEAQKELESLYQTETLEYGTVLLNKAGTYRYMGDLKNARAHFERAESILSRLPSAPAPVLAGLYNNIGLVWLDEKDPGTALSWFARALPIVDADPELIVEQGTTRNNIANADLMLGRKEDARLALDQSIEILSQLDCGRNPHYPASLNSRGAIRYQEGDYAGALKDFLAALDKTRDVYGENIEYAAGCSNCALVFDALGQKEKADQMRTLADRIRSRIRLERDAKN